MDADRLDGVGPDYTTRFFVFMAIFWPLSLLLGIVDHWFIEDYDLRPVNVALAALVGWVGAIAFEAWRHRLAEREGPVAPPENPGWLAVRGRPSR